MTQIEFKGPFNFYDVNSIFSESTATINGVYLWCVKISDDVYRVHYVGEAADIKKRMRTHLDFLLGGRYSGHCIDSLKNNKLVIMHRATEGMIPRFSHLDSKAFNQEYSKKLYVFYAEIPILEDTYNTKWLRCRFETGIITHIENQGENIISVAHRRYWKGNKEEFRAHTGKVRIESLSDELIIV
ncbi:MAG: hypothetical protein Q7L07_04240 [Pseudohongiella sp.]|nr:hypothetical protein [Pseudohongiella sp.]